MSSCRRACRYRASEDTRLALDAGCDYISITHKSRLAAAYKLLGVDRLTPEAERLLREDCPCYAPGEWERARPLDMPTPRPKKTRQRGNGFNTDAALELYADGASDREIAEAVGAKIGAVYFWRHVKLRLPPNTPIKRLDGERILELYHRGMSDGAIAETLGLERRQIMRFRKRQYLKVNGSTQIDYKRLEQMYRRGLTDAQIAEELGCSRSSVERWRLKSGLTPNRREP